MGRRSTMATDMHTSMDMIMDKATGAGVKSPRLNVSSLPAPSLSFS